MHIRVERDLSVIERIERQPLLAVVDCLTKLPAEGDTIPIFTEYLRTDFNSLQLWQPDDNELLAQIIYLQDSEGNTVCHLGILPSHKTHILTVFAGALQTRMHDTLRFIQASANASRHRATTVRFHYSQSQDISNISPSEALKYFPYEIRPLELTTEVRDTLACSPNILLDTYAPSGLQPLIQQAMQDQSINPREFGKGARNKGGRFASRNDREVVMDDDQDDSRGKDAPKGKGKGKKGKRAHYYDFPTNRHSQRQDSAWHDDGWQQTPPRQYQWREPQPWNAPSPTPVPWQNQNPTPATDRRPGWGTGKPTAGGKGHRLLDDSTLSSNLVQCDDCSALLGTNSDCAVCVSSGHVEILQGFQRFQHLVPFSQPIIPWFPCPFFVEAPDGTLPSCNHDMKSPCYCCSTWDGFVTRYYSGSISQDEASPVVHSLMAAYERAIVELLEDPTVLYVKYQETYQDVYSMHLPDSVINWWYMVLTRATDTSDPLTDLPRPWKHITFTNQSPSLLSQYPAFHQLSYSVDSCNVQGCSMILRIVAHACSFIPEHLVQAFELPNLSVIAYLGYSPKDIITLDLIPWHSLVRETFRWAFQDSRAYESFTQESVETVAYYLLHNNSEFLLDQFCRIFANLLSRHTDLTAVFLGQAPFVNDPLRRLAAAGSSYFDTVYHNMAAIYGLHTTSKQHILAPNEALCTIYDLVVKMSPPNSTVQTHATAALSRNWNNRGNSMEALSLMLAERGEHTFIVGMAWIVLQLTYATQAYPWLAQYLQP